MDKDNKHQEALEKRCGTLQTEVDEQVLEEVLGSKMVWKVLELFPSDNFDMAKKIMNLLREVPEEYKDKVCEILKKIPEDKVSKDVEVWTELSKMLKNVPDDTKIRMMEVLFIEIPEQFSCLFYVDKASLDVAEETARIAAQNAGFGQAWIILNGAVNLAIRSAAKHSDAAAFVENAATMFLEALLVENLEEFEGKQELITGAHKLWEGLRKGDRTAAGLRR